MWHIGRLSQAGIAPCSFEINLPDQDLTVSPILRTADGLETTLAAVTIKPAQVKSIDIGFYAPQLAGKYGSVRLHFRALASRSLYASIMINELGHPIAFHIDGTELPEKFEGVSREGIWWLPNATAADYLIVTNLGAATIHYQLSLYDSVGKEFKQDLTTGPRQTSRLSVRQIIRSSAISGTYGGITIQAGKHAASLDSLHLVFDEQAEFSALLKMFDHDKQVTVKERDHTKTGTWTLRAPMLALSEPDPALAFPNGTVLHPQVFVRNTSARPALTDLRFVWRTQSATGKAAGPQIRLAPFQTVRIDVGKLQDGKTFPKDANWASVVLATKGLPDEVMAVAASYDDSLRYGTQTPFSDQLGFKWEGSQWEYDVQHDSIITAGNGGTKPTRTGFTLFYNEGTEKYELEQDLKPDEQMWIDVGELVHEQIPDKNGKTLPVDLASGSYEFRNLTDPGDATLFEGKVIYDKTFGHVAYGCSSPCCDVNPYMAYNPLGVPLLGTSTQDVWVPDNCGGNIIYDSPFWGNWSTASQSIATVGTRGNHTGVGLGPTTSYTHGNLPEPYGRYMCSNQTKSPSGPTTVKPDHLLVISDVTSVLCTTNSTVRRIIKYWEVDVNGNQVGTISTEEQFASKGANSCNTTINTSETCSPDTGGQLQDAISVGCNSVGGSCGTTFTKQQWLYCPSTGSPVVFATPGDLVIHNNAVTVGGSSQFAAGTRIGPNGVF